MASSLWQVGVGLGALAATYPITRSYDKKFGVDSRKRPYPTPDSTPVLSNKRLRFSKSGNRMAFRKRSGFRRTFRRRRRFGRRRRFRSRRGSFKRAVKRVILRTAEPKLRITSAVTGFGMQQGDGTSKVVYVMNPLAFLNQGTEDDMFLGNKFFVKGISFRGQVGTSGEGTTFQGALVRVSLVWSKKQNAALTSGWNLFGSTTTRTTNPTATAPNENPTFFESGSLTGQFTGSGWVDPFDVTTVTVISSRTIVVNPGVENEADAGIVSCPTPFSFYYKLNKWMQIEDPTHGDLSTVSYRFKHGTYYFVLQCVANTNDVSTTAVAEMDYKVRVHFRDP